MKENTLKNKSKKFAIRIVNLCKYLQEEKKEFILSKQLLRSGTSIGANVREAEYAASKDDFKNKNRISLKEASETEYWLEVLHETNYLTAEQFESIYADCSELCKLLISSLKTLTNK